MTVQKNTVEATITKMAAADVAQLFDSAIETVLNKHFNKTLYRTLY